jgi:hypothetical protein
VEQATSSVGTAMQAYQELYGENSVVQAIADQAVKRAKALNDLLR